MERTRPLAHEEGPLVVGGWSFEPLVVVGILVAVVLYARGWVRLHEGGRGAGLPAWRAWSYYAGLVALALALLSPIGTFDDELFTFHMLQHLLLILAVAPLTLLGAPLVVVLWGLPAGWRRTVGRGIAPGTELHRLFSGLSHPLVAAPIFLVTLAIWHVPDLYDAAQGRTFIHDIEHALFLVTALLYWWPVIHPTGGKRRLGYGLAIPYLIPPLLEGNLIGALLTFAPRPLYATYRDAPRISGLTAVEDQQLAGLIMWVPSGFVYLTAIFLLLALFLRQEERAAEAAESRAAAG